MYEVYFTNFGYPAQKHGQTVDEAKDIARKAAFQSQIVDTTTGKTVATYCPLAGFKWWDRSYTK